MTLEKKFQASVVGLFLFLGKVTRREFSALTVVMQTLATQPVPGATKIGTGAILGVDFGPWAFIQFFHIIKPCQPL